MVNNVYVCINHCAVMVNNVSKVISAMQRKEIEYIMERPLLT